MLKKILQKCWQMLLQKCVIDENLCYFLGKKKTWLGKKKKKDVFGIRSQKALNAKPQSLDFFNRGIIKTL